MISTFLREVCDDSKEIQATIRNMGSSCQAYFADWNYYPTTLNDTVPDYIPSFRNSWSTGPLVYYTSGDKQYFAIWEGNFRVISSVTGRFVMDNGSFDFKSKADFETFINGLPD